jgi:hypothetical protein
MCLLCFVIPFSVKAQPTRYAEPDTSELAVAADTAWKRMAPLPSPDTSGINTARLAGVLTTQGAVYLASLTGLYFAWYKDYPQSAFHLFNDGNEWMQVDKCGHAVSAFYISRIGYSTYRWAGLEERPAAWYGGFLGFAYMLNIEILDGFSSQWGFSPGDLAANTLGSLMFVGQQLVWHEQRFSLKYSFHQSSYATYRPDLLGRNLAQNLLKDYNGQSYWLSGNISAFLPKGTRFPAWLNIAVGYGAEGMTGAGSNQAEQNGQAVPAFARYRKFYLSLDVDLTRIPTKSSLLKGIFTVLSMLKIPAPALEYNTLGQLKFYPFYF